MTGAPSATLAAEGEDWVAARVALTEARVHRLVVRAVDAEGRPAMETIAVRVRAE